MSYFIDQLFILSEKCISNESIPRQKLIFLIKVVKYYNFSYITLDRSSIMISIDC